MIEASSDLLALMQGGAFSRADLYTIAPVGVEPFHFTSADRAITLDGVTYQAGGLRVSRDRLRLVGGLETDSFKITLTVDQSNEPLINDVPFRQAVQWGLLDGAEIDLSWAYISAWGTTPTVVGVLKRFVGRAANIGIDRSGIKIEAKSWLVLLDTQVPTQLYQASCRFLLGDANCGVERENHAVSATVTELSDTGTIVCSLTDADKTWDNGWVSVTSGVNAGVRRGVRSYDKGLLTLVGPLPWSAAVGDALKVYPACDKTLPSVIAGKKSTTVPAKAPYTVAIDGFISDSGVTMTVVTTAMVWGESYSSGGDNPYQGGWTEQTVTTTTTMAQVSGTPASGQYNLSASGVYTFSAADTGNSIAISYRAIASGTTASCYTKFGNASRFGGMPFIPVAETAV